LEFLQLEEDKELKNGTQDNVQEELEDPEAVEDKRPEVVATLLEVVMQEDTLHLKENLAVVEQEVLPVLFMEPAEEAEEP
jgi:predicted house-cleaning noncanonical NTP pyrophosphatase (MazG superfamily)